MQVKEREGRVSTVIICVETACGGDRKVCVGRIYYMYFH